MSERTTCDKGMFKTQVCFRGNDCERTLDGEGGVFTKTLRPDLVKKANMEWKMLSLSWGMVHGVGFL